MRRWLAWVKSRETHMFHYMNQQIRCKPLDFVLPKITHLGGAIFTIGSLLVAMLLTQGETRGWTIEAALSLALSHIVVHILKKFYRRERPYLALPKVTLSANPLKDYSFPSGHSTAVFSISVVFALYSMPLAVLLLPIATVVSLSRIYLGLHYPTDCLIGALLGSLSSVLVVFGFPDFY